VFETGNQGFVRDIDGLVDSKRVQVRADCDDRAGLCAFEKRNNAMMGDVGFNFINAEGAQFICDNARGTFFTIGELRVHVKVASDLDQSRTESGGGLGDLGGVISLRRGELNRYKRNT
jgi:hypothetical protein